MWSASRVGRCWHFAMVLCWVSVFGFGSVKFECVAVAELGLGAVSCWLFS